MEHKAYCTKCKTMTPAHIVGTKICAICYPNASEVSSMCCGEKIAELEKEVKSWRAWSAMHEDKAFQDLRAERDRLVAELDATRAELACVKDHSLRVVPEGDALAADRARLNYTFVQCQGEVFMAEHSVWDWVKLDGTFSELDDDVFVQPVNLERWKA